MVYGAIDLHMRSSEIRIVDEAGAVLWDRRILTARERFVEVPPSCESRTAQILGPSLLAIVRREPVRPFGREIPTGMAAVTSESDTPLTPQGCQSPRNRGNSTPAKPQAPAKHQVRRTKD
jgi:hypothetical protein